MVCTKKKIGSKIDFFFVRSLFLPQGSTNRPSLSPTSMAERATRQEHGQSPLTQQLDAPADARTSEPLRRVESAALSSPPASTRAARESTVRERATRTTRPVIAKSPKALTSDQPQWPPPRCRRDSIARKNSGWLLTPPLTLPLDDDSLPPGPLLRRNLDFPAETRSAGPAHRLHALSQFAHAARTLVRGGPTRHTGRGS